MLKRLVVAALAAATIARPAAAQPRRDVAPAIDRYFQLVRAEYSGERAKAFVAYMGAWFRWPGNTAFDASLEGRAPSLSTARMKPSVTSRRPFSSARQNLTFMSSIFGRAWLPCTFPTIKQPCNGCQYYRHGNQPLTPSLSCNTP